jgi:GNAT superfamily N-acetyltransferase
MRVERARDVDADAVLALLDEAAVWLTARDIVQWRPGALPRRVIDAGVARGEVFVVRGEGGLDAALTLAESDLEIWGPDDGSALYLHRLAVARACAGRGLGRRLLAWARSEVVTRGRARLRLDCVATNDFLRRYYATEGFAERGEVEVGSIRLARFELTAR